MSSSAIKVLSDQEMRDALLDISTAGSVVFPLHTDVRNARNRILQFWTALGAKVRVDVISKPKETILTIKFVDS